jgi:hypothetical protein
LEQMRLLARTTSYRLSYPQTAVNPFGKQAR